MFIQTDFMAPNLAFWVRENKSFLRDFFSCLSVLAPTVESSEMLRVKFYFGHEFFVLFFVVDGISYGTNTLIN